MTTFADLTNVANRVAVQLLRRGETVAVAESSAGGLVSAALLTVVGASAWYLGGAVIYTMGARTAFLDGTIALPAGIRGATEGFAVYEAQAVAAELGATWGVGETGATGPTGNRYGDDAGHAWIAVHGPAPRTKKVATGSADRPANMFAFAEAALNELEAALIEGGRARSAPHADPHAVGEPEGS